MGGGAFGAKRGNTSLNTEFGGRGGGFGGDRFGGNDRGDYHKERKRSSSSSRDRSRGHKNTNDLASANYFNYESRGLK